MRTTGLALFVASFSGLTGACGEHRYINLEKVDVERLADGRVKVTATAACEQVGRRPCSEITDEYCTVVRWTDPTGAVTGTDRQCVRNTLERTGAVQRIEVVSSAPLPPAVAQRAVVELSTSAGTGVPGLGARGSPTTVDVPPAAPPAGVASASGGLPSASPDAGIPCKADGDCPSLPCGPCTPGAVITREALGGPQCTVNPCRHAEAACNGAHVCVVGPKAEKEPAVWRTPPPGH
jgi:hypothetical protein